MQLLTCSSQLLTFDKYNKLHPQGFKLAPTPCYNSTQSVERSPRFGVHHTKYKPLETNLDSHSLALLKTTTGQRLVYVNVQLCTHMKRDYSYKAS